MASNRQVVPDASFTINMQYDRAYVIVGADLIESLIDFFKNDEANAHNVQFLQGLPRFKINYHLPPELLTAIENFERYMTEAESNAEQSKTV